MKMADDVVDTIAQYDLDDDFPDYANEQNKELNQIVRISTTYTPEYLTFRHTGVDPLRVRRYGYYAAVDGDTRHVALPNRCEKKCV